MDWIRTALRSWDLSLATLPREGSGRNADLARVLERWVQDQHDYFKRARVRESHKAHEKERWAKLCMWCAFAGLLVLFGLEFPGLEWVAPHEEHVREAVIIAIDLFLAIGALTHSLGERNAYEQHAKQYARMQATFGQALTQIELVAPAGRSLEVTNLLRELGRAALAENGDWVRLHRERPMEVPHP